MGTFYELSPVDLAGGDLEGYDMVLRIVSHFTFRSCYRIGLRWNYLCFVQEFNWYAYRTRHGQCVRRK